MFGDERAYDSEESSSTERDFEISGSGRTCVVCRKPKSSKQDLIAFKLKDGLIHFAADVKKGRCGYLCISQECIQGLNAKNAGRALRSKVHLPDLGIESLLENVAYERICQALGLARRQGILEFGVDPVVGFLAREEFSSGRRGIAIRANDLSDRSSRRLTEASVFATRAELGRYTGLGSVGAVAIRPGTLAEQVSKWLRVWYLVQAKRDEVDFSECVTDKALGANEEEL